MSATTAQDAAPAPDLRRLAQPASADGPPAVDRLPYPWAPRVVLPLTIVLSLLSLTAYAAREALWPAVDVRVVPVVVKSGTIAAGGGGGTVVQAAGWVEPDPHPVHVTALADGVVGEVLVLEGDPVEAGQVVATLVDADARVALARAEADLAQKRAELTAATRHWENPVERTRAVAAAEAIVAETQAELLKLESEVAAERAKVEELADQLARSQQMRNANAATEKEVVTARLQLAAQEASLAAAEARRPVLEAQLRQRQADLVAAREHLKLRIDDAGALAAAEAAVTMAEAARDEAQLRLERMRVVSPVDGVVMSRHIDPGSKLMLGMDSPHSSTAVRLYDPNRLQVRVDVPLDDAAKVGVGMPAEVVVGVLPERTFDGTVTRVVHEADVSKNTIQVKVAIQDPVPQLKPEMLARVRFLAHAASGVADSTGSASAQVVFAPASLIVEGDRGAAGAWVVDGRDDVARFRPVTLGDGRQDGWIAIASGLGAGDRLIADPPARLEDGTKVRVIGEADVEAMGGDDDGVH